MPQPRFSLVTVTRNAAATLPATLASTAAQTFRNFEHLIIDGASSDTTLQLAQAYKDANPDIAVTIISEPDGGLYHAMNKAFPLARGRHLAFLNAGDRLHSPQTLAALAPLDGAVLYGETDLVDAEGHFLRHRRLQAPRELTPNSFKQGMLVCHQSFYVRRELATPYDLSYRYSADYDWCIRVMREAQRRGLPLTNAHQVLTDYLADGLTTAHHRASLLERLRIMAHHYGWPVAIGQHLWFVVRAALKR